MDDLTAMFEEAAAPAPSKFEAWVSSLPDERRVIVLKYATDTRVSTRKFIGVLRSIGGRVGETTAERWRREQGYEPR